MNFLLVFIGGGIGSLLRFSMNILNEKFNFYNFPLGTFISNILASLLLGIIIGYFLTQKVENESLKNLLIVGICGGFSTFSSFSFENYNYFQENQLGLLLFYSAISITFSLFLIYIGIHITKQIYS